MNAVTPIVVMNDTGSPVTTSLAIADGIDRDHKHVIRLVRNNIVDLQEFGGVRFEIRPFETPGGAQHREIAVLNEQQATLLLTYMRNNDVVRAFKKALVKAFYEMARNRQPQNPAALSRTEILQMALEAETERQELAEEVQSLLPKAAFHDRVAVAEGNISMGEAAKVLGFTGRNRFMDKLREKRWLTRKNEPYQDKIEAGLMAVKLGSFRHPEHGIKQSVTPRVTGKGLTRLEKLLGADWQGSLLD